MLKPPKSLVVPFFLLLSQVLTYNNIIFIYRPRGRVNVKIRLSLHSAMGGRIVFLHHCSLPKKPENTAAKQMFHFTKRRIQAHVCICFVALKVYKELERILDIDISVDKVLEMAKTVVTIQIRLPKSKQTVSKVMLMKRHQKIAFLFDKNFWVTR